jgi:hypothetical protein
MRNSRKIKEKLFTKIYTLFYVLGSTFGLFSMVKTSIW